MSIFSNFLPTIGTAEKAEYDESRLFINEKCFILMFCLSVIEATPTLKMTTVKEDFLYDADLEINLNELEV